MPAAVTLSNAAFLAQRNTLIKRDAGADLNALLTSWAAAIAAALPDPSNVSYRRALDWIPRIREIAAGVSTTIASQTMSDANEIAMVLYRSCLAAANASAAWTGGEDATLLASYNAIWA